ncbi:MAG: ipoprotein LpqH [Mycobacterium sp.]|jgi:lipoprotein LpqH|nr:ipoprotein LpqH [Mycobacterium sp.]MDT5390209.1 ipoprotein LpqH [Mycobacterium sp.]MDT5399474.1 ipoprotein LpqH [Mycobacterium sp.]MDT7758611.1 ipoprotein LpqH [Mycobacterium sp.]
MKRALAAGVVGTAMVVAGLVGCSSSTKPSSSPSGSTTASPIVTKVVVDGQDQNVTGAATCTVAGDNTNIGIGDPTNGVGAVVSNTDPPAVHAVGLGSPNGSTMGYSDAAQSQGSAEATKVGNSYKITGTAVTLDTTNSQPVTKSFELDVACP